jgi:hypothetical protein
VGCLRWSGSIYILILFFSQNILAPIHFATQHFATPAKIGHFAITESCAGITVFVLLRRLAGNVFTTQWCARFVRGGRCFARHFQLPSQRQKLFWISIFAGICNKMHVAKCQDMNIFIFFPSTVFQESLFF